MNSNLYLDMFVEEAKEHIDSMNEKMLLLEKNPDHEEIVQELFRSAHTIKGMAATMGFEEMTTLTHELEGVLDNMRNQRVRVNGKLIDSMLHCIDLLEQMLLSIASGEDGKVDITKVLSDLKQSQYAGNESNEEEDSLESSESSGSLPLKHLATRTIRVDLERMDMLMNLFTELVIDRGRLEELAKEINNTPLTDTVEHIGRITGDMQNIILNMRMIPIEQVFSRFPRMVRDLARELKKRIRLEIHGSETEMDRTVIDEIGEPLIHLLRNAIDHGIESPEQREKAGKPPEGLLQLKAYHNGNGVLIEVKDDGNGIDREKIVNKAVEQGLISPGEIHSLTPRQIDDLMFLPGLSTVQTVSDVSGRGVGLDVVKTRVESLGGSCTVESVPGKGTTFYIQLPLTLSIISAMLVKIENETYAIPLNSIIEAAVVSVDEVFSLHQQNIINFRGHVIPLIMLKNVFNISDENKPLDQMLSVVIVRKGDKLAGLVVDSFIDQREIVLKSLGNYLNNVFAISGATILGNGQVALVVDCNALIL